MEERWGQKTESWTKAAPHLEKVKHQQLWDLFRELMRQSGARLNPGASGIFQPHVLLDTYSQFEKKKKKNPMDAHFHSGRADVPLCWACTKSFFLERKCKSGSGADATNALYICLNEAATRKRLTPSSRVFVCIPGN